LKKENLNHLKNNNYLVFDSESDFDFIQECSYILDLDPCVIKNHLDYSDFINLYSNIANQYNLYSNIVNKNDMNEVLKKSKDEVIANLITLLEFRLKNSFKIIEKEDDNIKDGLNEDFKIKQKSKLFYSLVIIFIAILLLSARVYSNNMLFIQTIIFTLYSSLIYCNYQKNEYSFKKYNSKNEIVKEFTKRVDSDPLIDSFFIFQDGIKEQKNMLISKILGISSFLTFMLLIPFAKFLASFIVLFIGISLISFAEYLLYSIYRDIKKNILNSILSKI